MKSLQGPVVIGAYLLISVIKPIFYVAAFAAVVKVLFFL
jgi:hypothetical protein